MVGGVVKIVEVYLLFIDDRFKKLHAGAVPVFLRTSRNSL
jgi:hypothetical protein